MHRLDRMTLMRAKLILAILGCAVALAPGGCAAPWPAPVSNSAVSKSTATSATTPNGMAPPNAQIDQALSQADMAGVLEKIQQVRAIDPVAEQKLLDELRRVPVSSWPLVAEQFRASLAYHEQLADRTRTGPRDLQPVVDLRRTPRTSEMAASPVQRPGLTSGLAYQQSAASNDDRPSRPIGTLLDPHGANSETVPILARSMPYAMPSPIGALAASRSEPSAPAPFTADGPTYPIANRKETTADVAALDATGAQQHVATQAAAQTIASPTHLPLPVGEGSQGNWQQLVQKAIDDLNHRVSESPTTTAEVHQHVSLRMLRLLSGDTEKALEPIPHISPAEQDYWSRQLFALATYLDHHSQPDDKRRAAASVTHLDEAVSHLRELGSLTLRNLSFCKNVYGYGAIEPYESDTFGPGQHVSLYVELENYHSTSSDKGFRTSVGSTYELLDEKGNRVTSGDFPDVNDCCRSRRRDFHIQFGLALPENIAPGRYQLQLIVKDRQSDKIGNAKVPFEIRGGKK